MSDSSFRLLKFSPLKTPDVRKAIISDDEYATSSSVASSVTNEIISLSRTVQKKITSDEKSASSESSPEKRSGENLFLTQRFCEPDCRKGKSDVKMKIRSGSKSHITRSKSDTDDSSGSDLETSQKLQNKLVKKKQAGKEKHKKANNSSSSSSSSESDSSTSSIDKAKYQSLMARLKANSFRNDMTSSDSDNESSSGHVENQVAKDKQVENFSQDLFSPVSVKHNANDSSEVRLKSPKKVLKQHKSELKILKPEEEKHGSKEKQPHYSELSEQESDFDDANEVKENENKALKTNPKPKLTESPQMLGTSPSEKKSAEAEMRTRVAHDLSGSESESGESDMSSVIAKLPENSVIAAQNTASGSDKESESDNDDIEKLENIVNTPKSHSPQKGNRQKLESTEKHRQSLRQSKITDHCSPLIDRSSKKVSRAKKSQIRYEAPVGFENDEQTDRYVTEKDVEGRQLWLIQTPVDFDVSSLDNKKIKFDGIQTVCVHDEKERQYEVVIRSCQDNQGQGYSSVVMDEDGNHKLGDSISGQIQVLDWVPGIPPVKIDIPTQQKHEVPDNLTLRYVPFGAESPKREEETAVLHGKKMKRKHERSHREGKKKKKKERKEL